VGSARGKVTADRLRNGVVVTDILSEVRAAAAKRILFLPHALQQMARPERMISAAEVEAVVTRGELVEDYPDDARGHSCLLLGKGESSRLLHVCCAPKPDYLAVITAYVPNPVQWSDDFMRRLS